MYRIVLFVTISICLNQVSSYVLLQVRKDEQNRSNVDALIHKVVPSNRVEKLASKIARKQFSNRLHIDQTESKSEETREKELSATEKEDSRKKGDTKVLIDDTIMGAFKFVKDLLDSKPEFRTKDFHIKPQRINFRSDQGALMYEVDATVLLKALKDFLSSKLVAKYTDDVAKRAALVYRALRNK